MSTNVQNAELRTVTGVLVGLGLVAIAIGILIQQQTASAWHLPILTLLIVEGAAFMLVPVKWDDGRSFAPNGRSFMLVWGALMLFVGLILTINMFFGLQWYAVLASIVLVVGLIAIILSFKNRGPA